ncbi:MAG: hypothetical protein WBL63_20800 [Candidatus Acidiferrum sp.]
MSGVDEIHWHGPDRDCNWSMVKTMAREETAPQCVCGRVMKKSELVPAFQYLTFVRKLAGVQEEVAVGIEKE